MKKTLLIMVMALAVLLTQCRKPEVKFPSPVAPEGTTVSMTVTAGPGSKTDITTAGGITWSTGDKLYVGFDGKYVGYLTLTSGQNTPTGWFSGDVTLTGISDGDQTFHFFYLGSTERTLTVGDETVDVDFSSQNIYADGDKLKNASAQHVGYGSAKGTVAGSEVTGINVTLVSKVALACFSFKKSGTPASPYEGALTLSGDHIYNSMTVGFGGTFSGAKTGGGEISLTDATSSEKYVMLVPAEATAATLKFDAGAGTTDCYLANGIEANKYYGQGGAIEVTVTVPVPVTGVELNKSTLSLEVGAYETLTATVSPDNADNKSVTWGSSAPSVATVSSTGVVTAVAAGTATITVTATNGTEDTSDDKTATCTVTVTAPPCLPGEFTINSGGTKVKFSKGNLYAKKTGTEWEWGFYEHQYDMNSLNSGESRTATPGDAEIDLFTWGYGTWSTNPVGDTYETDTFTDWGTIPSLPDNAGGTTWRTLTRDEWDYLLNTRTTATGGLPVSSRYAKVTVNGVSGLLLFPDSFAWTSAMGTAPTKTNTGNAAYTTGSYTVAQFTEQEKAGVVFLPAAGYRYGTGVHTDGSDGYYWSSTLYGWRGACIMVLNSDSVFTNDTDRDGGNSVRLVRFAS